MEPTLWSLGTAVPAGAQAGSVRRCPPLTSPHSGSSRLCSSLRNLLLLLLLRATSLAVLCDGTGKVYGLGELPERRGAGLERHPRLQGGGAARCQAVGWQFRGALTPRGDLRSCRGAVGRSGACAVAAARRLSARSRHEGAGRWVRAGPYGERGNQRRELVLGGSGGP